MSKQTISYTVEIGNDPENVITVQVQADATRQGALQIFSDAITKHFGWKSCYACPSRTVNEFHDHGGVWQFYKIYSDGGIGWTFYVEAYQLKLDIQLDERIERAAT